MPGAVAAAAPSTVLPLILCQSFQQSRMVNTDQNQYPDASQQSNVFAVTSRKRWALTARLTGTALVALRTFYLARNGPQQEFWMYDLFEAVPMADVANYDATGASINGRYTVRFEGKWTQALDLGRNQGQLGLIEVG